MRIGLPDHPTPSSLSLASEYYPDSSNIAEAAHKLADLDPAVLDGLLMRCLAARDGVPIDKPDPAFKGPF